MCSESQAVIRADGTIEVAQEQCGPYTPGRGPEISWNRRTARISRYDVDRLARLTETIQFDRLLPEYSRPVTHGEFVSITIVYRDGMQRSVIDYAQAAPGGVWLLKRAVAGVAIDGYLTTVTPGAGKK